MLRINSNFILSNRIIPSKSYGGKIVHQRFLSTDDKSKISYDELGQKSEFPFVRIDESFLSNINNNALGEVTSHNGLKNFMKRTYLTSLVGITSSLTVAEIMSLSSAAASSPFLCLIGGAIMGFGGIFAISKIPCEIKTDENGELKSENPPGRLLGYGALTTGMGITLAPLVSVMPPSIMPSAIALSLLTMGGASLFAYKTKSDSLLKYGPALSGGLCGLVGLQLLGLGSYFLFGPNVMYSAISSIDTYGGILLFAGLTAYGTHNAITMYKNNNPDHLQCATGFYLDFMNILIRFMKILSDFKKD